MALKENDVLITERRVLDILEGKTNGITEDEFQAIVKVLESAPDAKPIRGSTRPRRKIGYSNRIPVTQDIMDWINNERERTGHALTRILKYAPDHPDKPKMTTAAIFQSGRLQSIKEAELEYAKALYKQYPDRQG